jgi:hypothetical protein
MLELRILMRMGQIVSLTYDDHCGEICGAASCDIVDEIHRATLEPTWREAYYLKAHAPTNLFSPVIVLSTLIIRRQSSGHTRYNLDHYKLCFERAVAILKSLSRELPIGSFVDGQVSEIVRLTLASLAVGQKDRPVASNEGDAVDIGDLFSTEIANMANDISSGPTVDWFNMAFPVGGDNANLELEEFSWEALFDTLGQSKIHFSS